MKKILFITGIILLFTLPHFSSDFSVSLSVNYNHGTSDFFQKSQLFLTYNGLSFIEKKHNQMGMGFNLSVCVPIMKKLYIVPGFNLGIGHQVHEFPENYEESNVDPNTNNMQRQNSFFYIYSGELNLLYDLLKLKNGWNINLLFGLNYNVFDADTEMRVDNEKYWGLKTGIGAKFLHLKHFGFQFFVYYKIPFTANLFSYFGAEVGIIYKL